jgi:zinc transport system substrate-binding protein
MTRFHRPIPLGLLGAFLVALHLGGCGHSAGPWDGKKEPRVMASFPPLYCFAVNVAGDDASVLPLLEGVGIHEYEPSPRDAVKLNLANLLLLNGLELDNTIAQKLLHNTKNPRLKVYEVGKAIPLKDLRKMDEQEHDHDHGHAHAHDHKHGAYDPHVWLGLPEAILMVNYIRDRLKEADPTHAKGYDERSRLYTAKLQKLWEDGKNQLKDKKERKLISFHDSLHYFARSFDLQVLESIQPLPGEDPSSARLQKLFKLCQEQKVRVIAVEPNQMGKSGAKALVAELNKTKGIDNAEIIEIDVLESATADHLTPAYYEERMRENIAKLAKALQ